MGFLTRGKKRTTSHASLDEPAAAGAKYGQVKRARLQVSCCRASRTPRLSLLERLPVELLEAIFSYCPNPSLPQSSPSLGWRLSHRPMLLRICVRLWGAAWPVWVMDRIHPSTYRFDTLAEQQHQERWQQMQGLMECPWFDLAFVMSLHQSLIRSSSASQYPWTVKYDEWPGCVVPTRPLCDPCAPANLELLAYLVCNVHLNIDLCRQPAAQSLATQGLLQAIALSNWFVVKLLLSAPRRGILSLGMYKDLPRDLVMQLKPELVSRRRFNLDYPHSVQHGPELCASRPYFCSSQSLLRAAVIQHGCHKGIVATILAHSLYDCDSIDFLDSVIWNWATDHGHDGLWLVTILRVLNSPIRQMAALTISQAQSMQLILRVWRSLQQMTTLDKDQYADTSLHLSFCPPYPPPKHSSWVIVPSPEPLPVPESTSLRSSIDSHSDERLLLTVDDTPPNNVPMVNLYIILKLLEYHTYRMSSACTNRLDS